MSYVINVCIVASIVLIIPVKSTPRVPTTYTSFGNITIGGLFPLHYESARPDNYSLLTQPAPVECIRYNFLGFRWMQAMVFAIQQINNRSDILPDVNLGYQIFDTCNTHSRAVNQAIYISENNRNQSELNISAVIGPTGSAISTVTSNIFSIYDIPQISYASTSRILSDKKIYNSFFRTIPNDDEQTEAILDLLLYYDWNWVGAIAGDDDYGRPGITKLKELARANNICIEYTGYVSQSMTENELIEIAKEVRDFNATVFVLFISTAHLQKFAKQLSKLRVYDKVWIASEAWATSTTIRDVDVQLFEGTLGIAERGGPMPGFREFLKSVSPLSQPNNPFINEFWERSFNCTCYECFGATHNSYFNHSEHLLTRNCSLSSSLTSSMANSDAYLDWTGAELEKSYNVYVAVYALAHALENVRSCKNGYGLLEGGFCPTIDSLEPWQLLAYLKQVNFSHPGHLPFYFDEFGDPQAAYKIVNWQPRAGENGATQIEFVDVGYYSAMTLPTWTIDRSEEFYWNNNRTEIPFSVCTDTCSAGFYRVRLASVCCFECLQCPVNQFSTENDSSSCMQCNVFDQSNLNRTGCIPKHREYVRWNDVFGITFAILVGVGVTLTLFCASLLDVETFESLRMMDSEVVFFKHRKTPMVKATNVEISFLLFISIACCFLTPLFYIAKPEEWSCQARMLTFSLSFTLSVAAILVKTLRVLTAFKAKVPVRLHKRSKWLGAHLQIVVVLCITLIQVCICAAWLIVDPSTVQLKQSLHCSETVTIKVTMKLKSAGYVGFHVVEDPEPPLIPMQLFSASHITKASSDTLLVECSTGNLGLMISMYIYLSVLAGVAFLFAFRARKLPENFNEAKFITFSMLIFFIVWLSFIPAYLTTKGLMNTVVYCIAILASTFGILSCIFFPKLYVILITPERNTKIEVRASTASHAIRSTRRKANNIKSSIDNLNLSVQGAHPMSLDFAMLNGFGANNNNNNNNNSNFYKRNKHHKAKKNDKIFHTGQRESCCSEFTDRGSIASILTLQTSIQEEDTSNELEVSKEEPITVDIKLEEGSSDA